MRRVGGADAATIQDWLRHNKSGGTEDLTARNPQPSGWRAGSSTPGVEVVENPTDGGVKDEGD